MTKIIVTTGDNELSMTPREARELFNELVDLFAPIDEAELEAVEKANECVVERTKEETIVQ